MRTLNIFKSIPEKLDKEALDILVQLGDFKIERIVSKGHISPESGWYNQAQDEWVIVLQGAAVLTFADGKEINLTTGDHLNIPAFTKHKVSWTDPDIETVWIAVFYGNKAA